MADITPDITFSEHCLTFQEPLLRKLFPDAADIHMHHWADGEDAGADATIKDEWGDTIAEIQLKCLRHEKISFERFTAEYFQNRHKQEEGEYFNPKIKLYLHGYCNEDKSDYAVWYFIRFDKFKEWFEPAMVKKYRNWENFLDNRGNHRPSTSNASFICIRYDEIPKDIIISHS